MRGPISIQFLLIFKVRLLLQQKFRCVNIIGRSWRTWEMNQITPTQLTNTLQPLMDPILLAGKYDCLSGR